MKSIKIVIITQGIHPSLDPRSHRSTQLAFGLANCGHQVTVYSLLGNYDYSEIRKKYPNLTIKNLGKSICGLSNSDGINKHSLINRGIKRVIGKYISFPGIELIPMINKVLKKEKDIDLLISIAFPYEDHWGVSLSKYLSAKCWISDCGDPYMGNPFHQPPFYFKYIEKYWCKKTDYITIPIDEGKGGYYPEFHSKIKIIPQGFDFNVSLCNYKCNDIPTFAYAGVVYNGLRDPRNFLNYLSTIDSNFKFIVYTKQRAFFEQFKSALGDKLEIRDYVPRNKLLYELSRMDFLINIKNNSSVQQPSKLIDYALSKRPILSLSSEFDATEIRNFNNFINADYSEQLTMKNIDDFNIINVANRFIDLYNEKTKNN